MQNEVNISDSKNSLAKELVMSRASLFKEELSLQKENIMSPSIAAYTTMARATSLASEATATTATEAVEAMEEEAF